MPHTGPPRCGHCGAVLSGRFCGQCGAAGAVACAGCGTELSAGALYCHRCGEPARAGVSPQKERRAWIVAAMAITVTLASIAYQVGRGRVPARVIPNMGNAGNAGPGGGGGTSTAGRAPDISQLSPLERFDRLYDRVVRAAGSSDTAQVLQFAPMALGAYQQLDSVTPDSRYRAAVVHLTLGEAAGAKALADTILAAAPGHLLGYVLRGEAAEQENDAGTLNRAYADFLAHYDAELAKTRPEYHENQAVLEDFRTRARANARE